MRDRNKLYVLKQIEALKKYMNTQAKKHNVEKVLRAAWLMSSILYSFNQYYYDEEIEELLLQNQKEILEKQELEIDSQRIMFYDGFGLDGRGLAQIYLKALCKLGKLVYVTNSSRSESIPVLKEILNEGNAEIAYVDDSLNLVDRTVELNNIVKKYKPGHMFFYTVPDDVVAYEVFAHYEGQIRRYQVNLTDHAFWLGAKVCDVCIEFRNYGASISALHRQIAADKLTVLPFYPVINRDTKFQGYPFEKDEATKVIFSGGTLYKTIGGEGKYYKIVEHILQKYKDVIFWYAGSGESKEMDRLLAKYPDRLILTKERSDLYQVLEHSYFYLSTYPLCGGLMFQYAAEAGVMPLTLKFDHISDDFLIHQEELGVIFEDLDSLLAEIDRVMEDVEYRNQKSDKMRASVISESDFEKELKGILLNGKTSYEVKIKDIDTIAFREEYLDKLTPEKVDEMFVRKRNLLVEVRFLPQLIRGTLVKLFKNKKSL